MSKKAYRLPKLHALPVCFAAVALVFANTGLTQTANPPNPGLSISATRLSFSTPVVVTQVSVEEQSVTISNKGSASFPLTLAVTGDFSLTSGCPAALAAAASCVVEINFEPSGPGERDGLLSITSGSGYAPAYVSLSGTGLAILPANDGTLNAGQTLVGEPAITWYKIQAPIASLTATSGSMVFGVALVPDTGSGHGTLPASSFSETASANCNNCWLGIEFYPVTAGTATGSLSLSSNTGAAPYTLVLAAIALPVQGVLITPSMVDYGSVADSSSSGAVTFTVSNLASSGAELTVQSVVATGDFQVLPNTSGGASCAGALEPGASCFVQVSFTPKEAGGEAGSLTVSTTAGSATAALAGTGTADPGVSFNPDALSFQNVPGPTATRQAITLSNTSVNPLTVAAPTASDTSFNTSSNCTTLGSQASCTIFVVFIPQTFPVTATLSIPVTATNNGQTITTVYTVPLISAYTLQNEGLQIVADHENYGAGVMGSLSMPRIYTLNNLTSKDLSVQLTLPRQFPAADVSPCMTLAANESCSFSVDMLPLTGGPLTGTIVAQGAAADGSGPVQGLAYVQGYGAASGNLSVTGNAIPNTPMGFGQLLSGQQAKQVATLTNAGTTPLTVRRLSTQPPFFSTTTCGRTLAPGASCTVNLTYAPVYQVADGGDPSARSDAGQLIIESDAASSPDALALTGSVVPTVTSNPLTSATLNSFTVSEGSLTFPNTQVGNISAAQQVGLTNVGTTTIHILSLLPSADFASSSNCATLLPGDACSIAVTLEPTTASSSNIRSGTLEILSDADASLEYVTLLGFSGPSALTLTPGSLDFGTVDVGATETLNLSVTNSSQAPVKLLGLSASGDYSVAPGTCPAAGATLAAGSTCALTVSFAPSATGTRNGALSLSNDSSQLALTAALTGNGVLAQLSVSPGALSFGSVDVTSSSVLTLTLLNTGTATVTGIQNGIAGADASDFAVTSPCSVTSLAPNQGCTETVTFTPSATGTRSALLSVQSSDHDGPATIPLSGTGVAAGSFTLTVNGASAATVTVSSGSPATYALLLTPAHGFSGVVDLTCTPVTAAEYASCSLLASSLTLGTSALGSTATINTITSASGEAAAAASLAMLLLLPFLPTNKRQRLLRSTGTRLALGWIFAVGLGALWGCGGGGGTGASSNVRTTPPGTYQYVVTASSTSGVPVTSSVTLTLVVH